MYRTLDVSRIIASLTQLEARIEERFPGAGLSKVCAELTRVARETSSRVSDIRRPRFGMRIGSALVLLACVGLFALIVPLLDFEKRTADNVYSVLQGVDAALNIVVLTGASALFLFAAEERAKRKRALAALHELRSLVHVIDMHQLTKDPMSAASVSQPTASSPKRTMTPFELSRYLDYCSELLSLAAKVGALYAQGLPDPVVVDAVSDLERLTSNLSAKAWQKIALVERYAQAAQPQPSLKPPRPASPAPQATPDRKPAS
jgi:hypothetical protein